MTESGSLVPDGAKVLVDTENDQDEFGDNPRQDYSHAGAEQARDEENHSDERVERHSSERGNGPCKPDQHRHHHREPVKKFDDSGRDEPLPLEQIADAHARLPGTFNPECLKADSALFEKQA
jgi:hypothetical protein